MSEIKNHEFLPDDFEFAHEAGEKLIDRNYKASSYWKDVWGNFSKNKGALIGSVIILIIIFFALVGPSMNPHTYKSITPGHECLVPRIPGLEKIGIANGYFKGNDQYAAWSTVWSPALSAAESTWSYSVSPRSSTAFRHWWSSRFWALC